MKRFAVISNEIKDPSLKLARQIEGQLISIMKDENDASVVVAEMNSDYQEAIKDTEALIVLGGDGTLLRVAKDTLDMDIPMIGVNLGTVGFLAEVEIAGIETALRALVEDRFHSEERMMLSGTVTKDNQKLESTISLNDVVLSRRGELQVVGYRVIVNGMFLTDVYADGIIISTPTGSTGYNMSAGGSIVEPMASLIVLTPVCPHTLSSNSIILSDHDTVEIMVLPPKGDRPLNVGVYFDGRGELVLTEEDKVIVCKSDKTVKLLKLSDKSFLEVLHKKFEN